MKYGFIAIIMVLGFISMSFAGSTVQTNDMYCVTNNVIIYNSLPAEGTSPYYNPSDTNTPWPVKGAAGQLMKYDRVKLIETKGDWSFVSSGLPVKNNSQEDTKARSAAGWVVYSSLSEWKPEEFLKEKENVFTAKNVIELYESPLVQEFTEKKITEKPIAKVETNESYRVLKGNGERFFVVTSGGMSGWVENKNIEIGNLVAKRVSFEETKTVYQPKYIFTNETQKRVLTYYFPILPEDILDTNMINGNNSNVFSFLKISAATNDIYLISKNGVVTNINSVIGVQSEFDDHNRKRIIKNINNKEYFLRTAVIPTFFGMFAKVEIWIPTGYEKALMKIVNNLNDERMFPLDKYISFVNAMEGSDYKEIVKIRLFTRDEKFKDIGEINLEDKVAFLKSLEYIDNKRNQLEISPDGTLSIKMVLLKNGALLDPFVGSLYDSERGGKEYDPVNWESTINTNRFLLPVDESLKITKSKSFNPEMLKSISYENDKIKDFKRNYQNGITESDDKTIRNKMMNISVNIDNETYQFARKSMGYLCASGRIFFDRGFYLALCHTKRNINDIKGKSFILIFNNKLEMIEMISNVNIYDSLLLFKNKIIINASYGKQTIDGVEYEY